MTSKLSEEKYKELEEAVLGTLSFYEKMNESFLIMDLDSNFLLEHPELDKGMLNEILENLVKKKLAKKISVEKDIFYQRLFKKPPFFKRLRRFFGM